MQGAHLQAAQRPSHRLSSTLLRGSAARLLLEKVRQLLGGELGHKELLLVVVVQLLLKQPRYGSGLPGVVQLTGPRPTYAANCLGTSDETHAATNCAA